MLHRLLRLLFQVQISGDGSRNSVPKPLFVANHASLIDGILLALFLPWQPTVIVPRGDLKHWLTRLLFKFVPHQVVDSNNPLAIKKILRLIQAGRPVAIFPDIRAATSASLSKFYDAAAWLAVKSGATVIPVHIGASEELGAPPACGLPPKRWLPRLSLHIQTGSTLDAPRQASPKQKRALAARQLQRAMEQASFAAHRTNTLFGAFLAAGRIYGWNRKIVEDISGKRQSYRQLLVSSLAIGKWASQFSVERQVVGVLLPNLNVTTGVLLGLIASNRIPAMLNYTAGASGIASACTAAGITLVVSSRRFLSSAKLHGIADGLKNARVVCIEDIDRELRPLDKLWIAARATLFPSAVAPNTDPHEAALIVFTSGSENHSKGVVLSHAAILANVEQIRAIIDFTPRDRFLNILPMHHVYGLTVCTMLPLLNGANLYLYPSPLHYRAISELVRRWKCTCLFGTSAFLGHYATHAHADDFRSLRYVISGGEKLNEEVRKLWMDKFALRILEGYGAAECSPVIAFNTPAAYKQESVGQFLPAIEHRIEPVPGLSQGGILHVRGPNLMLGYYLHDQPALLQPPRSSFGPGWHCTGDVVEVDDQGFVTVTGRVKRFAKIAGEMVSLEIVEKIACQASPRQSHAATLLPDVGRGEVIVLFTTDPALNRLALSHAAKELGQPELAVARQIAHLAELPLLAIGKVDYVRLKGMAQHMAGATSPPRA